MRLPANRFKADLRKRSVQIAVARTLECSHMGCVTWRETRGAMTDL